MKIRRIIAVILVVMFAVSMFPVCKTNVSAAGKMTIEQLKAKFPAGKYWNGGNADSYTSSPCTHHGSCTYSGTCGCNSFKGLSIQCMGYAEKLGYDFTGYNPRNNSNGWYTYTSSSSLNNLKPGDIVRFYNGNYEHSIFIIGVSGDTVTYTDCNSDGHCIIRWGKTITKTTLKSKFIHLRSAPYSIDSKHTLSIKYDANGGIIKGSDKTYNKYKVSTSAGLNMRSNAGTSYSVLISIPQNKTFVVTSTKTANGYTWGKTTYSGNTGWVVISEDWTTKTGTQPQTTYYLNSSELVYTSSTGAVKVQNMVDGESYADGLYNYTTFGISRDGYVFKGWGTTSTGGTIYSQNGAMTAKDIYSNISKEDKTIILYAIWEPIKFTICYNANGGVGTMSNTSASYQCEFSLSSNTFTKQGYSFSGWNVYRSSDKTWYCTGIGWKTADEITSGGYTKRVYANSCNGVLNNSWMNSSKTADTITFYAVWTPNTLTVSFNTNGGSINSDTYKSVGDAICYSSDSSAVTQEWTYNNKKTNGLPNASTMGLYKDGCVFLGWGTTATGTTILDQNNVDLVPTQIDSTINTKSCSKTLYAIWVEKEYTVTFDVVGGECLTKTKTLAYNSSCGNLPTPTKDGYSFKGWYTASENGTQITSSTTFTKDTTVYAQWTPNTYNIKYNGNGSTGGNMSNTTHTYDVKKALSKNTFTKNGYTFAGWKDASGKTFADEAIVSNLSKENGSTVQLTAQWTANKYTVTFDANGGYCSTTTKTVAYNSVYGELPVPSLSGYTFVGWYTDKSGVTNITSVSTFNLLGNQTLYAQWSQNHIHSYSNSITKQPACTEKGIETFICSCGDSYTQEIPAIGHKYSSEWTIDTVATCQTEGSKSNHCENCDRKTNITTIPALEHTYSNWIISINPSCNSDGSKYSICDYCDNSITDVVPATGHNYSDEWIVDKEATCNNTGLKSQHCTNCGEIKESTIIPVTEHNYGEWIFITAATCTSKGSKYKVCDTCNNFITAVEPEIGHSFSTNWTIDQKETCTQNGIKSHHCSECGERTDITVIIATGHYYGSWYIVEAPTCKNDGIKKQECINCEDVIVDTIPASDHIESLWIEDLPATLYANGSKHKECVECDEVLKTATIPQLKCAKPALKKVYNANDYVKVTWGTVKGADLYRVYRKTGTGEYEYIGSTTHTYFNDKEAGAGKTCRYYVKAKNEAGNSVASNSLAIKHIDEPTLKSIENSAYGVLIKWYKVTGAEKYNVYRKVSGGEYEYIGTTENAYYTDKTAESGTKYYYAIRGKRDDSVSSQSASLSKYYLADPTLNVPTTTSEGIGLSWSEVEGAEGYKVYRKTADGSYKLLSTVKGVSNLSYTDSSAYKGTKYTYKVKAYKSKTYSAYSNTKTITDKY
ncbi:MAG: InlB B-repeat-containing protein [Clostridia bacterium]|nr:InlB B-repeat-containing protein [Clostridia bacterium]